jgi:hypothetical protein
MSYDTYKINRTKKNTTLYEKLVLMELSQLTDCHLTVIYDVMRRRMEEIRRDRLKLGQFGGNPQIMKMVIDYEKDTIHFYKDFY